MKPLYFTYPSMSLNLVGLGLNLVGLGLNSVNGWSKFPPPNPTSKRLNPEKFGIAYSALKKKAFRIRGMKNEELLRILSSNLQAPVKLIWPTATFFYFSIGVITKSIPCIKSPSAIGFTVTRCSSL
jgi:hypothetical protein